jgi:hypothetical protein
VRNCLAIAWLPTLIGCSDGPVRQAGVVTLEGNPLAQVTVTFMSTENKRPATATTDQDGRFELTTANHGDGAFPGEYKVVVRPATEGLPPGAPGAKSKKSTALHANYQDAKKTPLRRVVPAPDGEIKLELKNNGS